MESIPVPSVQALAANLPAAGVPEKYLRPEESADAPVAAAGSEIPIVDFHRLLHPEHSPEESEILHRASQEWGFFQLVNHSVPADLIRELKADVESFFGLALETKLKFAQERGQLDGYGQLFVVSEEQKLDWADVLFLTTLPVSSRNLRAWPDNPPTFRSTLEKYSAECSKLVDDLLGVMAKKLGICPDVIARRREGGGVQSVRMNCYPPCTQAHQVLGFAPHSDGDLLTLVLQVNDIHGLQVKNGGVWVPVIPLPNALICNVGDSLEIFTNGKYRSVEHRAVVDRERARLSVAAFHSASLDATVGPLPELVRGSDKAKYRSIDHESFMREFFSSKLQGKSFLDSMRVQD